MTQTQSRAKKRMTRGKFDGINAVADGRSVIAAMAIDQRARSGRRSPKPKVPTPATSNGGTSTAASTTSRLSTYRAGALSALGLRIGDWS